MDHVSATELAKLAKCERQLYLDARYGDNTELTARYIKRGNEEHEQFRLIITGKRRGWLRRFMRWLLHLFFR
jgi:hypothetical protein